MLPFSCDTTFAHQRTAINLQQRKLTHREPAQINIGVDTTGRYTVNNASCPAYREALTLALRKAVGGAKEPTIIINADSNTTHHL